MPDEEKKTPEPPNANVLAIELEARVKDLSMALTILLERVEKLEAKVK